MEIKHSKPIIWPLIKLCFPKADWEWLVTAWGDTIYTKYPIKEHMKVHELVHLYQQRHSRLSGLIYFVNYVVSPKFRLMAEIEAFRAEYKAISENKDYHIDRMAKTLSGAFYKNIISYEEAIKAIIK